ncbi:MAG: hypothetical protein Q4G59_05305 [Planctomycetia bacterium]|nr:hypothetical protein [Planctomycetia bacterium]
MRFPVLRQANGTPPGTAFSQNALNNQDTSSEGVRQQSGPGSTGIRLSELVTSSDGVIARPMASVSLTQEQKNESGSPLPALSAPSSLTAKKKDEGTPSAGASPSAATPFPAVSSLSNAPTNTTTNAPVNTPAPGTVAPLSSAPNNLSPVPDRSSSASRPTIPEQPSFPAITGNNPNTMAPGSITPAPASPVPNGLGTAGTPLPQNQRPQNQLASPAPPTPPMSIRPETALPSTMPSGNSQPAAAVNLPQTANNAKNTGSTLSGPSNAPTAGTPDFVRPTKSNFPGLVPGTGLDRVQSKTNNIPGTGPSAKVAGTGSHAAPQAPKGMMGQGRPGPTQMEGAQEACIVLEKIAPKEVQVNREETFGIIVKNTGKGTAKNIVLRDQVPARTVLVSTTPKVEPGRDGELVWKPFDLGPGEQKEFKYVLVPQEEGELGSVASVTFSAEASARTKSTKPVLRLDVKAPQEIVIGGEFTLEIAISNTGTGTANGVVLLETIPDELFHPGGKVLDNQIKTIAPQETKQLVLTLKGVKPGKAINRLSVKADNGLIEERETPITVTSPELQLEIAGAKTRYLDREATYVLKIHNPGTAAAKNIQLVAELPKNVEFVRTNNLGEYNKEKHAVCWELVELPQNLPPGELELVVKPVQPGNGRIVLRGTGQNDLAAEVAQEIAIDGLAALAYEVRSLTDPVEVGKEAIYEVRISNRGTKASTNINMSILIPAEMKIIASDGPTAFHENGKGVTFGRLDSLDPKKEAIYRVRAVCSKPGDHRIKVQVSSDDMELLVKEESTRVYY